MIYSQDFATQQGFKRIVRRHAEKLARKFVEAIETIREKEAIFADKRGLTKELMAEVRRLLE